MKSSLLLVIFTLLFSCISNVPSDNNSINAGWSDEDTYIVKVIDNSEEKAIDRAKHQILKDIVDVRLRNNSQYTDIIKIREEFNVPLNNGRIIRRFNLPEGLQIYFEIHNKGLKKKFQRQ